MIGEIVALVVVVVLPVSLGLAMVAALGLAVAGFGVDPQERRFVRR